MKILIIINDAPYGSEHMYNGLRLAGSLAKHEGTELKVFLSAMRFPARTRARKCRRDTTTCRGCWALSFAEMRRWASAVAA